MSQEVAIILRCDICEAATSNDVKINDDDVKIITNIPMQIGGKKRLIDLCSSCRVAANTLLDVYIRKGRAVEKETSPIATMPSEDIQANAEGKYDCTWPECDRDFSTEQGMKMHRTRAGHAPAAAAAA